jgi:hypothetical protein
MSHTLLSSKHQTQKYACTLYKKSIMMINYRCGTKINIKLPTITVTETFVHDKSLTLKIFSDGLEF